MILPVPTLSDQKVMLDFHLAKLYDVETRALKQAVRPNPERFPADFMFALTPEEARFLVSQTVIPGLGEPGATARGITAASIAASIAAITAAIDSFNGILTKPCGQIFNRSALLKEVATDTAALLEDLRDLDDLIPQFAGFAPGQRFAQAWQKARIIIDAGGGHGQDEEETPPPTPPAP